MILVTGATGQFGSKAIEYLLKKGVKPSEIAVLVRDEAKAESLSAKGIELRVGDYTDYNSLVNAFSGVDKLLLVSSNDRQAVENRTAQHVNVIKAAKQANVRQLVYTSFVRKPGFEQSAIAAFQNSHLETETSLKESGMAYTILQNGIYLEMIPIFVGDQVAEKGMIYFPAADGRASYVLREELAEAAAQVLISEGHENKTYALTNTQSVSFTDIANALSKTLGKEVIYHSPDTAEFESTLVQHGVPDLYIGLFMMWATAQAQGAMEVGDDALAQFLGRKPTSMSAYIQQVYG